MRGYLDLFFMGAAFLLLETTNIVHFALLFGTTWFVNALVFAGILASVYLAIEVTRRYRFRRPSRLYVPLFAALVLAWAVPPDSLLGLSFVPRFGAAVGLGFAPVFLANLIFADRFRDVGSSTIAFGTNLLGAIVGGVLEYGALVVGYRALLIGVAALYALALLAGRSHLASGRPTRYPALASSASPPGDKPPEESRAPWRGPEFRPRAGIRWPPPMERSAASRQRERLDLVFRSFAMLFMELALIRWVSAYDVYVAYFTNFVLLASFLGVGVGFLRSRTARDRSELTPRGLAIVTGFVLVFPVIAGRNSVGRTFTGLLGLRALPPWVMLPLTFLLVVAAMALVAEAVGRRLELFEPPEAYRLDILGSLAGIVVFSLLSFAEARPVVWGMVIAAAFVAGRMLATRVARVWAVVVVLVLLVGSISPLDRWSPYYRVTVGRTSADGGVAIRVNGLPHQGVLPLDLLRTEQPFYLQPYDHLGGRPPGDVLIIGAGSGNDVAVALSMGASHVDAVEIDPVLQATG